MSRWRVIAYSVLLAGLLGGFQNFAPVKVFNPGLDRERIRTEIAEIYFQDAKFECDWMESIAGSMSKQPAGATFTGAVHLRSFATKIASVQSAEGKLHLKGQGPDASLESVRDFKGDIVLCNMNLGSVENVEGNIIVVAGSIGSVNNVRGQVIVLDGSLGNYIGGDGIYAVRSRDGRIRVNGTGL